VAGAEYNDDPVAAGVLSAIGVGTAIRCPATGMAMPWTITTNPTTANRPIQNRRKSAPWPSDLDARHSAIVGSEIVRATARPPRGGEKKAIHEKRLKPSAQ
jgi:hypothetical protein